MLNRLLLTVTFWLSFHRDLLGSRPSMAQQQRLRYDNDGSRQSRPGAPERSDILISHLRCMLLFRVMRACRRSLGAGVQQVKRWYYRPSRSQAAAGPSWGRILGQCSWLETSLRPLRGIAHPGIKKMLRLLWSAAHHAKTIPQGGCSKASNTANGGRVPYSLERAWTCLLRLRY